MLDTKYALKYQMPHSLLHIVDNSIYDGTTTPVVVDDPSLYATLVVTGTPIGVDNRFVNLSRSDIASVSFGLGNITTDDIKRYGQTIEYPMSLIQNSGAPVRLMRVTPDGSTYAFYTILIQWKTDDDAGKMYVRFVQKKPQELTSLRLDRFKNTDRLNSAIVAAVEPETEDGWSQAVFMNIISAGRGKAYNDMAFAIDLGTQQKRALNCRYIFTTINTMTSQIIEQFAASLINNNVSTRVTSTSTPLESVNVAVGRRVDGSSILVPYVNETAISKVFTAYMNLLSRHESELTETERKIYKTTNINTFDVLFGNYVYDGSEYNLKLPRYQVEMYDTDVKKLSDGYVFSQYYFGTGANADKIADPTAVYDRLYAATYGVTRDSDSIHVGDIYVTPMNGNKNPLITLIATINQYTGAITPINIGAIKISDVDTPVKIYTSDVTIAPVASGDSTAATETEIEALNRSVVIKRMIADGTLNASPDVKNLIACVINESVIFVNLTLSTDTTTGKTTVASATKYSDAYIRKNMVLSSTTQTIVTISPTAVTDDTECKTGLTLIDGTTGNVYVGDYNDKATLAVMANRIVYGSYPSYVSITDDMVGVEYDVIGYPNEASVTGKFNRNDITIVNGGSGYAVGDTFTLTDNTVYASVTFKVTKVEAGVVTAAVINGSTLPTITATKDTIEQFYPANAATTTDSGTGTGVTVTISPANIDVTWVDENDNPIDPIDVIRYVVTGGVGSLYRLQQDPTDIPADYYTAEYGLNPTSENGGLLLEGGSTGFFDEELDPIVFKYRYSALLVKAYKGQIDPRILSPVRCPAKFLFDGGTNTIVTQTILPNTNYTPTDVINASTVFTDDEKDRLLYDPDIVEGIGDVAEDIDVKQAMYDLMIERCYLRIPEDKRPLGPGYGLSLHLDAGVTDATTVSLINTSFSRRFTNPNASWDIGGYVSASNGIAYTYTKRLADELIRHCKTNTINKPYAMTYATIPPTEYASYFPDIDMTDWELRELLYNSGGNAWVPDVNGNLQRRSQRTMQTYNETSDLVQESNMRTLSQLCYLLQNKIDSKLLEYSDDDVLRTLKDECNAMFVNWVGNLVESLDISFERDTNPTDGGDVVVCYCNVTFRGLILRVPIIVNVQRRTITTTT